MLTTAVATDQSDTRPSWLCRASTICPSASANPMSASAPSGTGQSPMIDTVAIIAPPASRTRTSICA
jgi:hypothetical protein